MQSRDATATPTPVTQVDIIGDVHGEADKLTTLLEALGYEEQNGVWQHPDRQAIFVCDLIDKGPDPADVLNRIRNMVEHGAARLVIGNHELNWINDASQVVDDADAFLDATRQHRDRRRLVHGFAQADNSVDALLEHFHWLRRQPLFIDEPALRVVHASWDDASIQTLKHLRINCLDDFGMHHYRNRNCRDQNNRDVYAPGYLAIDRIVAGCEHTFPDPPLTGRYRSHRKRVSWWPDADDGQILPGELLPVPARQSGYASDQPPVFFGHYALFGEPQLLASNVASVDYGATYDGPLVAYRHTLGAPLCHSRFVAVAHG